MKKALILLLALVYVTITSGVVVNIHYCMGEFAGVNYGHVQDESCGKCGMEQKDGCCQTEHKFIKAAEEHLFVKDLSEFNFTTPAVLTVFPGYYSTDHEHQQPYSTQYHSPPDIRINQLAVYNCVFRI